MKWLATITMCLLANIAVAQELNGIIRLPSSLLCGPYDPDTDQKILEEYGEIPFVEGDGEIIASNPNLAYPGRIRLFLDPNDFSYSMFIDIDNEITCLIVTGEKLYPAPAKDGI